MTNEAEWAYTDMTEALKKVLEYLTENESISCVTACCDTLQVRDYSKYNMASFNEEHKKEMRAKQFPQYLLRKRRSEK